MQKTYTIDQLQELLSEADTCYAEDCLHFLIQKAKTEWRVICRIWTAGGFTSKRMREVTLYKSAVIQERYSVFSSDHEASEMAQSLARDFNCSVEFTS